MLCLVAGGCGGPGPYSGPLYPVNGRALLADGKPLAGGMVQFIPSRRGLPATGKIAEDGSFSLRSRSGEGAAPGEYKIRVEPSGSWLVKKGRMAPKLPFAAKYREYDGNTGLTATIDARATQLEPSRLEGP
jgi:hypothetical protein